MVNYEGGQEMLKPVQHDVGVFTSYFVHSLVYRDVSCYGLVGCDNATALPLTI